ncbi:hypothetical protein C8J56DRAFT_1079547 [Mycena floridula]|nr:hypothetical protein C8J56DRAFT_1079547 [Mycena floridula]
MHKSRIYHQIFSSSHLPFHFPATIFTSIAELTDFESPSSPSYFLSTTSSSASLAIVLLENAELLPKTLDGLLPGLPGPSDNLLYVGLEGDWLAGDWLLGYDDPILLLVGDVDPVKLFLFPTMGDPELILFQFKLFTIPATPPVLGARSSRVIPGPRQLRLGLAEGAARMVNHQVAVFYDENRVIQEV